MGVEIRYDNDAVMALKSGVDKLANAVKVTLGPNGRNVIINRNGIPHSTKDGVTVAKYIELDDVFENMGAQLIKDIAQKTCDDAGDGTSTSCILTQAIIDNGLKAVANGANPLDVKNGIDLAVKYVVEEIKKASKEATPEDIKNIATISANGDEEIGKIVSEAIEFVGKNGVLTVESSNSTETYIDKVEGVEIDRGYMSPHFVTDQSKDECVLEDAIVLLLDKKLTSVKDIMPVLESVVAQNKSLLIICDDIDGNALNTIVTNKVRGGLKICAVKSPGLGDRKTDLLNDIAAITGSRVYKDERIDNLTSVSKVIVSRTNTTIIGAKGDKEKISERAAQINNLISDAEGIDKDKLKERLARLDGGVAILKVCANSEFELQEKIDRIDDAIHAVRAAMAEGIVPGGGSLFHLIGIGGTIGIIFIKTGDMIKLQAGANVISESILEPIKQLCINSCIDFKGMSDKFKVRYDLITGYNFKTNKFEDLIKAGVVDPAKVLRVSLENAASVAGLFLTTACVINNNE